MSETKFEVGDTVSWCGITGTVIKIVDYGDYTYPVVTTFPHERLASFTSDGKYYSWHKEPSLKLVSKAKKKITVDCWVNLYDGGKLIMHYRNKEDSEYHAVKYKEGFVTTVHLSKEIEI